MLFRSRTARAIGNEVGVDRVIAGVLPDGKEAVIRTLRKKGIVAMVGDGINDAPALTRADIGIAIGAGTDVAIDSADIVLMNSSLADVNVAIRISRATLKNIHENLFWAFFYNLICIPVAAGLFAWKMNPMIGAAAMSLSSFTVCMNALRLNLMKPRDGRRDRKRKSIQEEELEKLIASEINEKNKEERTMTKTLKVEGMMCAHCEARVKKALEAVPGVESATADHNEGVAVVTLAEPVADEILKAAVEAQDYKVQGVS